MKLLRTWIHFVCGWTVSSLNSMRSVFYFIPTDPIRKTVADLGFFQDPIRSNCFSWKCKLRGNRAGRFRRTRQVAIASTSPFKLSKFGKRLLKMKSNLCKWKNYIRVHFSQDACIYSNICTYIYISWEYTYRWTRRVWSELFEKWCGRLVEWIWKSDLLPVRRYSIIPAFVSLLSSILRLRGRVWKIAGNLFSRSHVRSVVAGKSKIDRWPIIRLQITSRLDTSADETDQSATPLSLGSIYRRAGRE